MRTPWTLRFSAILALLLIFTGVNLAFTLVRYFRGDPDYLSMLILVAITFYLNDRDVQRAYARPSATEKGGSS